MILCLRGSTTHMNAVHALNRSHRQSWKGVFLKHGRRFKPEHLYQGLQPINRSGHWSWPNPALSHLIARWRQLMENQKLIWWKTTSHRRQHFRHLYHQCPCFRNQRKMDSTIDFLWQHKSAKYPRHALRRYTRANDLYELTISKPKATTRETTAVVQNITALRSLSIICHKCYKRNDYAPDCVLLLRRQYRVFQNYGRLISAGKMAVPTPPYCCICKILNAEDDKDRNNNSARQSPVFYTRRSNFCSLIYVQNIAYHFRELLDGTTINCEEVIHTYLDINQGKLAKEELSTSEIRWAYNGFQLYPNGCFKQKKRSVQNLSRQSSQENRNFVLFQLQFMF